MDLLVEQLNSYCKIGIPKPSAADDKGTTQPIYSMEDECGMCVSEWGCLGERQRQQQTALWELVQTEQIYLNALNLITDLFLACLRSLQSVGLLVEIDRGRLFSNVEEIYGANRDLWQCCLLPMVEKSKEMNELLNPSDLRQGFLKFGNTCEAYIKYCLEQGNCQKYCREKYTENELFKAYLAWCETRKECKRLRLMDILVRPMQRLTKYSLLLKAILKHTEDSEQQANIQEMILSVESFVKSVNGALRSREEGDRIKGIAERIDAYEVVETREEELEGLVKSYSKFDLTSPMPGCGSRSRWLLFEGELKFKDATTKMDAQCFLFSDLVLICKSLGRKVDRLRVIRGPYAVDRLVGLELKDGTLGLVYLSEYSTPLAAFSLHSQESKTLKTFKEQLAKAQHIYAHAKQKESLEYSGEGGEEENKFFLRSPLQNSSRNSHRSSLLHSHSGSLEMNEVSALCSQGMSFDQEFKTSSFSSDDGNTQVDGKLQKTYASPRPERRIFLSKSTSPNTLSVGVGSLSGQSLPNLLSPPDPLPHTHSLIVPKGLLSPTQRGISYPPPSSRNLRRSQAILPNRNPPLQKIRNIVSTDTPNHQSKGSEASHLPLDETAIKVKDSETLVQLAHSSKRAMRNERLESKRYHTAGVIDDIKKEVRKESSIQKRLSFNYSSRSHPQQQPLSTESAKRTTQSCSMCSVSSSSGVSSTSSLFPSHSDLEVLPKDPPVRIDVSEPEIENKIQVNSAQNETSETAEKHQPSTQLSEV